MRRRRRRAEAQSAPHSLLRWAESTWKPKLTADMKVGGGGRWRKGRIRSCKLSYQTNMTFWAPWSSNQDSWSLRSRGVTEPGRADVAMDAYGIGVPDVIMSRSRLMTRFPFS